MKKIVPLQIAILLVIIGTYVGGLAIGGSEQTAVAAVFGASAVAAAVAATTFAVAVATFAVAAVAAVDALLVPAALVAIAVVVFARFLADIAEDLGIPKRWTFMAFGIEAGAIFGALTIGSVGWAIPIGAVGILALLAVWQFGPRAVLDASPAGVAQAPHPNGG